MSIIKKFISEKLKSREKDFRKETFKCFSLMYGISVPILSFFSLLVTHSFSYFIISFFLTTFAFLVNLKIDSLSRKKILKNENYSKIINCGILKYAIMRKKISKEEEKKMIELCKETSLNDIEIDMIKRMILSDSKDKGGKIDNEYLMLKFLNEIEKQNESKKVFNDPADKIKGQMILLNKMKEKILS